MSSGGGKDHNINNRTVNINSIMTETEYRIEGNSEASSKVRGFSNFI